MYIVGWSNRKTGSRWVWWRSRAWTEVRRAELRTTSRYRNRKIDTSDADEIRIWISQKTHV